MIKLNQGSPADIIHCDYCGRQIKTGEKYCVSDYKQIGNNIWICHYKCAYISHKLREYMNLYDYEMIQEDFQDGCLDFLNDFICPTCNQKDECDEDLTLCIDKIYNLLLTNDVLYVEENGILVLKLVSKNGNYKEEY